MAILLISGSPRPEGLTIRAVRAVDRQLVAADVATDVLDLAQVELPTYRGEPVAAVGLESRRRVRESDALILASPEYHGGMSGAMKTFLDYLTFDEVRDRCVGFIGVASSPHGGTRPVLQMQEVVTALWGRPIGPALAVSGVKEAFDEQGGFRDAQLQRLLPMFVDRMQAVIQDTL